MHGERSRDWWVLYAEQYLPGPARTTSLGAKTSINAAPMIPTRKRTTALPGVRGTRVMKLILVIVGILGASAAHAQNAPWCLQPSGEAGGTPRCTYATFQQCLADRKGNGFCIQNSTYQPSAPSIRRQCPRVPFRTNPSQSFSPVQVVGRNTLSSPSRFRLTCSKTNLAA